MDVKEMFNGVAVVIDDEVMDSTANISGIVTQIESVNIPVLKYSSLPESDVVGHFQNLSFLLLDWRLIKEDVSSEEIEAGNVIPDTLQQYEASENIEFIKNLDKECFCPIFLFTNEPIDSIETLLAEEGLLSGDRPSNIFIRAKNSLIKPNSIPAEKFTNLVAQLDDQDKLILENVYKENEDGSAYEIDDSVDSSDVPNIINKTDYCHLFEEIGLWLQETPSVYVLKEWEREYQKCKTKLFSEFHAVNPAWPTIMWKNFDADGANKSLEMGELISRNLHSRMTPFEFKNDVLDKDATVPKDDLRKVLEGERFLRAGSLHPDDIGTGDLFKEEYQDGNGETKFRYYLNIRAQCDLIREDDPKLYTIEGHKLIQQGNGKIANISFSQGQYLEKPNHAVVAFLDGGKILEFKFSEFRVPQWNSLKDKRIGRLLPPHINRVQQRYALYMQRQGLPRIPDAAIFEPSA